MRQRIHCQDVGMPFGSRAAARRRVDAGIVDNRVHAADRIYLLCYAVGLGCAAQSPIATPAAWDARSASVEARSVDRA